MFTPLNAKPIYLGRSLFLWGGQFTYQIESIPIIWYFLALQPSRFLANSNISTFHPRPQKFRIIYLPIPNRSGILGRKSSEVNLQKSYCRLKEIKK